MTETAFAPRLRRLGSETLVYGLSTVVARFLNYFLQPYYAHKLTLAENGVQGVLYGYTPFVFALLYLGMDIAFMRNAAGPEAEIEERQRAFTMSMAMVITIGGALAVVLMATADRLAPVARLDAVWIRYMVAITFTDALAIVPYANLRMTHQAGRYAALKILFVVVSITLNVFLIAYAGWGVTAIFFTNVVTNLVVVALFLPDVLRLFRPALLAGAEWARLWAYALPIIPATLAVSVVENGDLIRLNFLPERVAQVLYHLTSKDVVGIYNFNYKLGVAMLLVVQMFRLAWVPFSLQHAREPHAPRLYSRVLTALMLVCAGVFLAISLWLPVFADVPVVHTYVKPEYWIGLSIVPVILFGYVFNGMYAVVTAGLYIERKTGVLPWIAGLGAALNIVICIFAAPRWGIVGVAWATPAAYALMAALGAWRANRVYPVPFEWGRIGVLGLLTGGLFFIDRWFVAHGVAPLSPSGLALKGGLLTALPGVLFLAGFFRHGEIRALRSIVSRG